MIPYEALNYMAA